MKPHFTLEQPRKNFFYGGKNRLNLTDCISVLEMNSNPIIYKQMESERTTSDQKGHFQRRITYTKSHKKIINAIIQESLLKKAKK